MNPELGFSISKDGQLPLTVWIEQFQEWHGVASGVPEPALDWERAWPPYPSAMATCQNVEELGRQLVQLSKRIQVLEQRATAPDPRSAPLG